MLVHLETLFQEVCRSVSSPDGKEPKIVGVNAKGDCVRWFDLAAEEQVSSYFKERFPAPVQLLSEEGAPRRFGDGQPEFIVVVDPVDGSDNFARKISPNGLAVALIPASCSIGVASVQFALVGDFCTERTWVAARGRGASRDGSPIRTRHITRLEDSLISCELNHFGPGPPLSSVLSEARGVRAFGCASRALSMVADGSVDAHLDPRGRLTPENFLAPSLILTEAGGVISDAEGKALPAIQTLTERYSIVAAATPDLHAALVCRLKSG
jgi:myo-inositol-1(or 4)-monophosphatase